MESNIRGLRCDTCWSTVKALWFGRFGGYLCYLCWSIQQGDTPESLRKPPALVADQEATEHAA